MMPLADILRRASATGTTIPQRGAGLHGGGSPQTNTHLHAMPFPAIITGNNPGRDPASFTGMVDPADIWPRAYTFVPMYGHYPMPDYGGATVADLPTDPAPILIGGRLVFDYKFDPLYKGPAVNLAEYFVEYANPNNIASLIVRPRPVPAGTPVIIYRSFDFILGILFNDGGGGESSIESDESRIPPMRYAFYLPVDPISTTCTPYP